MSGGTQLWGWGHVAGAVVRDRPTGALTSARMSGLGSCVKSFTNVLTACGRGRAARVALTRASVL